MTLRHASGIAFCVLTGSVLALFAKHTLFATLPFLLAAQVVAALLMVWARLTLGQRSFHATANPTEGGLVITGPYRYLRHPIYAAILLFVWAGVGSHATVLSTSMAVLASGAIGVRIGAEEQLVRQRYPQYVAYAAHTKRLIPFIW